MRRIVSSLVAVALFALTAQAFAAGVNLSWNDCGNFGDCNQSFACDSNGPGSFSLIGSFVPPAGVNQLTGEELVVAFQANTNGTMPDWWQMKNAGTCRQNALSATCDFTGGPFSCLDYWQGQGGGGIAGWQVGTAITTSTPGNYARLLMVFAVPQQLRGPVTEGEQYYAFRAMFSKIKTVGAGACGGCQVPGSFMLTSVKLTQPVGVGDFVLNQPVDRAHASWQYGTFTVFDVGYQCPAVTASKGRTWGSIKSLYR
ncbi:MAG: hypothetical protein U0704_05250 [Candidatus Eisenbacteria bacterium]